MVAKGKSFSLGKVNKGQAKSLIEKKINPIFIEYLASSFDKEDIEKIYSNYSASNTLQELGLVYGMIRAAELLEDYGYEDAKASLIEILNDGLTYVDDVIVEEYKDAGYEVIEEEEYDL